MRTLPLLLLAATVACAPTIDRFTATPTRICPGDPVTLSWLARGAANDQVGLITNADSIAATQQTVPADSSIVVSPTTNIAYGLAATNDRGSANARAEVSLLTPGDAALRFSFEQALSCERGGYPTQVQFVPTAPASPRLRVATLLSRADTLLTLVNVTGPAMGQPVGDPWTVHFTHSIPPCPPPHTNGGPSPQTPPIQFVRLEATAVCS